MSKRASAMQFIDDRADVDHDEEERNKTTKTPTPWRLWREQPTSATSQWKRFKRNTRRDCSRQHRIEFWSPNAPRNLPRSIFVRGDSSQAEREPEENEKEQEIQPALFLPDPQDQRATPMFFPNRESMTPLPAALPDKTPSLTASKREHEPDDDGDASSPTKRRRTMKKSVAEYFDIAAEESDEDGGDSEEEEEEETLSDKEFLDDEPTHESPAFYHTFNPDDAEDEAAEAAAARLQQASASYSRAVEAERRGQVPPPASIMSNAGNAGQSSSGASDWMQRTISNAVINAAPAQLPRTFASQQHATNRKTEAEGKVVPGSWIRIPAGSDRNSVALVLPTDECLVYVGNNRCKIVSLPVDCKQAWPTSTDLTNFHNADSVKLSRVHFIGTCAALTEGDRVVVVKGPHLFATGYITLIRDVPVRDTSTNPNIRVRYAKIQTYYNGTAPLSTKDEGYFVQLADLRRHVLDDPIPIGPLDRVRVVSGNEYLGYSGRVRSLGDSSLAVDLSKPPHDMELHDIDILLRHLTRDFHPGDMVMVARGKSKDRTGFITTTEASVEQKDRRPDEIEDMMPHLIFKVRSADVVFSLFANTGVSGVKQGYTTPKRSSRHPQQHDAQHRVRRIDQPPQVIGRSSSAGQKRDRAKHAPDEDGPPIRGSFKCWWPINIRLKVFCAWCTPITIALSELLDWQRSRSVKDGAGTRQIYAESLPQSPSWRLTRDLILTSIFGSRTYSSALEQSRRFESRGSRAPTTTPASTFENPRPDPNDPTASSWMRTPTPPPTLPGEDNGEWLCLHALAGKRVDVQIQGIEGLADHKAGGFKNSESLRKLEGRTGYLLLGEPVTPGMVGIKKLRVFACIKPFRGLQGMPLTRFKSRVVIIGADIMGNSSFKGLYGETQPPDHDDGAQTVRVRFHHRVESSVPTFPLLSLCQARNELIEAAHGTFHPTDFDEIL
ncbi:hypothetical protein C8R44DRAFT_752926 [Mycena epipterygia]|nr:hypothetical protein C8R44DRAFT_752926 [Mycena epipterygia]